MVLNLLFIAKEPKSHVFLLITSFPVILCYKKNKKKQLKEIQFRASGLEQKNVAVKYLIMDKKLSEKKGFRLVNLIK